MVVYGPPLAGKTTALQALAARKALPLQRFEPLPRSQVQAGTPSDQGLVINDTAGGYSVASICGVVFNLQSWSPLLSKADGLVLFLDPQIARLEANRECVQKVNALGRPILGAIVWTKQDIVESGAETVSTKLVESGAVGGWPVFRSRHDEPASLLQPIEHLLAALAKSIA